MRGASRAERVGMLAASSHASHASHATPRRRALVLALLLALLAFAASACTSDDGSDAADSVDDEASALEGGRIVPDGEMPSLPLRTHGRFIVDATGRRFKLASVSWYGAESPDLVPGGLDRVEVHAMAKRIKSLGFHSVRLPWSNELVRLFRRHPEFRLAPTPKPAPDPDVAVVADVGLVAANPGFEKLHPLVIFDRVVDALTSEGILVVLDNHTSRADWCCDTFDGNGLWYRDDANEADRYDEQHWLAHWRFMARRYAGNPRVIGAELRNELRAANGLHPTWGDGDHRTDWHRAAQLGGDAVLGIAPQWLVFVGGLEWSQHLEGVRDTPIALSVPNRLVYAPHEYSFFHADLDAHGYSGNPHAYAETLGDRWGFILTQGKPWTAPIWVSELGTCTGRHACISDDAAGSQGQWFDYVRRYISGADMDFAYWSLNGTQGSQQPDSRRAATNKRTRGRPEGYGILTHDWTVPTATDGAKLELLQALQAMAPARQGPR